MTKKKSSKPVDDQQEPGSELLAPAGEDKPTEQTQPEDTTQTPEPEPPRELTLSDIQKELEALKEKVTKHGQQIVGIQDYLKKHRKPTSNNRIQIRDKQTGEVYPSKNNAYQTLLKRGDLKDLVNKDIFGPEPEKNNYGWFALVRAWPNRFEEVQPEQEETQPQQEETQPEQTEQEEDA